MKLISGWAYPDADEVMWREMSTSGDYQRSHLDAVLPFVTDFSCAIDGGAHVGTWSRILSRLFQRVIAVEPAYDTFQALAMNMVAFGCTNVEVQHCALGKAHGMVEMAPLAADATGNTGARFIQPGASIPLVPIDSWHLPSLGFLKLDIEGGEPDALKGAYETLQRCRPIVLYEDKGFCRRFGYTADGTEQVLITCGYQYIAIMGKDQIWGPCH